MTQQSFFTRPSARRVSSCWDEELLVDNFAGGGGASTGIELAMGRSVDVAINHDAEALAMHAANHPHTRHIHEDVWAVDPKRVCEGRTVGLAWFSPDCKHFSRAKGAKPVSQRIRGLAWVAVKWAKAVRPRVICLENVSEFQEWGPLDSARMPCPRRKGQTFDRFVAMFRNLGYHAEWRTLIAKSYGVPTTRKRLFMVPDGRLTFHRPDGTRASGNAGAPSALIAYGHKCVQRLARIRMPGMFLRLPGSSAPRPQGETAQPAATPAPADAAR